MRTLLLKQRYVPEKSPGKDGRTDTLLPGFTNDCELKVMPSNVIDGQGTDLNTHLMECLADEPVALKISMH